MASKAGSQSAASSRRREGRGLHVAASRPARGARDAHADGCLALRGGRRARASAATHATSGQRRRRDLKLYDRGFFALRATSWRKQFDYFARASRHAANTGAIMRSFRTLS